jgi:nucleoside-diphosphate-sugar epimerase
MESPAGNALRDYPQILVTGGSGWLGERVVRALSVGMPGLGALGRGGQRVRCLVPAPGAPGPLAGLGISLMRGDLRRAADCDAFCEGAADGLLLHLAQLDESAGRTRLMREVNVTGTQHLLAAARRAGLRRMVLLSTGDAATIWCPWCMWTRRCWDCCCAALSRARRVAATGSPTPAPIP